MNDLLGRLLQLFSCFMWGGAVWIMLWSKLKKPSDAAVAFLIISFLVYANAELIFGKTKLYAVAKANRSMMWQCVLTTAVSTICFFRNPVDILAGPLVLIVAVSMFGKETAPIVGPILLTHPRRFSTVSLALSAQLTGIFIGLLFYLGCVVKSEVPHAPDLVRDLTDFATGALMYTLSGKFRSPVPASVPILLQCATFLFLSDRPILLASVLSSVAQVTQSDLSPLTSVVAGKVQLTLGRALVLTFGSAGVALFLPVRFAAVEYTTHTFVFEFIFGAVAGILVNKEPRAWPLLVLAAQRTTPSVGVLPAVSLLMGSGLNRVMAHCAGALLGSRVLIDL